MGWYNDAQLDEFEGNVREEEERNESRKDALLGYLANDRNALRKLQALAKTMVGLPINPALVSHDELHDFIVDSASADDVDALLRALHPEKEKKTAQPAVKRPRISVALLGNDAGRQSAKDFETRARLRQELERDEKNRRERALARGKVGSYSAPGSALSPSDDECRALAAALTTAGWPAPGQLKADLFRVIFLVEEHMAALHIDVQSGLPDTEEGPFNFDYWRDLQQRLTQLVYVHDVVPSDLAGTRAIFDAFLSTNEEDEQRRHDLFGRALLAQYDNAVNWEGTSLFAKLEATYSTITRLNEHVNSTNDRRAAWAEDKFTQKDEDFIEAPLQNLLGMYQECYEFAPAHPLADAKVRRIASFIRPYLSKETVAYTPQQVFDWIQEKHFVQRINILDRFFTLTAAPDPGVWPSPLFHEFHEYITDMEYAPAIIVSPRSAAARADEKPPAVVVAHTPGGREDVESLVRSVGEVAPREQLAGLWEALAKTSPAVKYEGGLVTIDPHAAADELRKVYTTLSNRLDQFKRDAANKEHSKASSSKKEKASPAAVKAMQARWKAWVDTASAAERARVFTDIKRRTKRLPVVVGPPGDAKTDINWGAMLDVTKDAFDAIQKMF